MCLDYHDEDDFHPCCYLHLSEWSLYFHPNLHGQIGWITGVSIPAHPSNSLSYWWSRCGICSRSSFYHRLKKGIVAFYFQNPLVGDNYWNIFIAEGRPAEENPGTSLCHRTGKQNRCKLLAWWTYNNIWFLYLLCLTLQHNTPAPSSSQSKRFYKPLVLLQHCLRLIRVRGREK